MIIFGTFEQSIELEQALADLERHFVSKEHIRVVFMDNEPIPTPISGRTKDIHSNAIEVGLAFATGSAVIGASIGFVLTWGPIIWGLILTIIGFWVGYGLYYFLKKDKVRTQQLKNEPETLVIIQCTKEQANHIRAILWQYLALTVGQVDNPS